jgi:hypothetical protein
MFRVSLFAAVSSTVLLSACCNPGLIGSVDVPLKGQETSMWCWAASGQMTMNAVHPASNVQQPDEANRRFGRTDCGNTPTPSACIQGGWPEYEKYNFTRTRTSNTALTWAQIRSEIHCRHRPFAFSWHWPGGGGHMMVVTGYVTVGGVNYVAVNNPWPPTGGTQEIITYDNYVGGPGYGHTHWDDFYEIRYTGN